MAFLKEHHRRLTGEFDESYTPGSSSKNTTILNETEEAPGITCERAVEIFIDHWVTQMLILFIIAYSLLSEDVRALFFDLSSDDIFMQLTIGSFVIFFVEICLTCFAKPDYFNSFFFWLDIVATLSILTDIEPVWLALTGGDSPNVAEPATDGLKDIRGMRGAKVGARAGRVARVIRLIRLIRIAKLYKNKNQSVDSVSRISIEEPENGKGEYLGLLMNDHKESHVGKELG